MWAMKPAFFLPRACIVLNKWKCTQLLEGVIPTVALLPSGRCAFTPSAPLSDTLINSDRQRYVWCVLECACVCAYRIQYNIIYYIILSPDDRIIQPGGRRVFLLFFYYYSFLIMSIYFISLVHILCVQL